MGGRRLLVVALIVTITCALMGVRAKPAAAGLFGPIAADVSGDPVDDIRADQALFALVRSDIRGGVVCIVNATGPADCNSPAWGTPNHVVGIGTMFVPLEGGPLHLGDWRLAVADQSLNNTVAGAEFSVTPCGDDCDFSLGEEQIGPFKLAASFVDIGATVTCLAQEIKGAVDGATGAVASAHGSLHTALNEAHGGSSFTGSLGIIAAGGMAFAIDFPDSGIHAAEDKAKEILHDLLCAVHAMEKDIADDPPDPDLDAVSTPTFNTIPNSVPAVNELAVHLDRLHGFGGRGLPLARTRARRAGGSLAERDLTPGPRPLATGVRHGRRNARRGLPRSARISLYSRLPPTRLIRS